MEIVATYCLSETGRKAAALEGKPAQLNQEIRVNAEDLDKELLQKIVEQEGVDTDGNVCIFNNRPFVLLGYKVKKIRERVSANFNYDDMYFTRHVLDSNYGTLQHDKLMTIQELVAFKSAHAAEMAAQKQQAEQELAGFAEVDRASRAKAEAAFAELQRSLEEREERKNKEEMEEMAAQEANEKKAAQERKRWIQQHGSERLKLALELEMDEASNSVYMDERLADEQPGFIYHKTWHHGKVRYKDAINPTLTELQALKEVKTVLTDAELVFAQLIEEDAYTGDKTVVVRERVIIASFLGQTIVKRFDS